MSEGDASPMDRSTRASVERPAWGRLAVRHALLAALCGLVFGIAFSAIEIVRDYDDLAEQERRAIEQMLAVMREPAARASYELSPQAAAVVVSGALALAPVRDAELRSDFGEVLARGSNPAPAGGAEAWWSRFVPATRNYVLTLEAGNEQRRVGELHVVVDQGQRVERFLGGVWRMAALSTLRSVALALVLGVLLYAMLARPLVSIAQRMHRGPGAGPPAPLPEARRADEIGEIAEAFERYEREAVERTRSLESAAAALSASEARYRRIVETAGEGVWQVDTNGVTTLANGAMAHMLGTTPDALIRRPLVDFAVADDQESARQLLCPHPGTGPQRRELRFLRTDGRELWAELSTCVIADANGRPAGALAMVTDVTERRRRDDELRATNAQLRASVGHLERHEQDMARIAEFNELLQSAGTEAEAYDVIQATATRLFAGSAGGLSIVVATGEELTRVAVWGVVPWVPERYRRDDCWAARRGGPHEYSQTAGVRCVHHANHEAGDTLCLPLYVDGKLLSMLHTAGSDEGGALDDAQRKRTEIFGAVIKLGLSNLRLRESLREQAVRDPLTDLPNRRMFDEMLPRELARCLRAGVPVTVAVVDVDHFKHFNDTYGHDLGDRVLRGVAAALSSGIRSGDLACRYGGDEFLCLLPGISAADARHRFERLLGRHTARSTTGEDALPEPVTFTVGLASAPDCAGDAAGLLRAADAALYEAKARGRNCVSVAQPPSRALQDYADTVI